MITNKITIKETENKYLNQCSIKDVLIFARVCKLFNRIIERNTFYQDLKRAKESVEKMNKAFQTTICFFCETPILNRIGTWNEQEISKYVTDIYKPRCNTAINEIYKFCKNNRFNEKNLLRLKSKAESKEAYINRYNKYLITKKLLIWNLTKGVLPAITLLYLAKEAYGLYGLGSCHKTYELSSCLSLESNVTQKFIIKDCSKLQLLLWILVLSCQLIYLLAVDLINTYLI